MESKEMKGQETNSSLPPASPGGCFSSPLEGQREAVLVIKVGGGVVEDAASLSALLGQFALLEGRKVLVHGGGKAINALMKRLDAPVTFKNGLRVTDETPMGIVQMALVGDVNQMLVSQINAYGELAVGISGADGRTLECAAADPDLGRVGAIEKAHEERYRALLQNVEMQKVFEKSEVKVWECRNCGHIVVGTKAPEVCPTCNHPQSYFEVAAENY